MGGKIGAVCVAVDVDDDELRIVKLPEGFDLSLDPSVSDIFFTWANGGVLCILPEDETLLPSEYIRREKTSFLDLVPSIVTLMAKMGASSPSGKPCFVRPWLLIPTVSSPVSRSPNRSRRPYPPIPSLTTPEIVL